MSIFQEKHGGPYETFHRWSTICQVHCITLLSLSLQDSTPQVKPVSIAFRLDMTETLADLEKKNYGWAL